MEDKLRKLEEESSEVNRIEEEIKELEAENKYLRALISN